MKVAILGFARDGRAAYDYWLAKGDDITICDENTALSVPAGAKTQLGSDWLTNLDKFDVLLRTAGLHPRRIAEANPAVSNILDKVTGNISEFLRVCPTKNVIGVTGTKGKGTTSTLIAKMLEAAGKRVHLAGNIGIGALDLLKLEISPDDWVVLEISSFQLIDQRLSPHIAVCLMVVPEHLNWHADMEEYVTAKQQLFAHQNSSDIAIYYNDNQLSKQIAEVSPGAKIPYMAAPGAYVSNDAITIDDQPICATSDIKLLGQHNWQNICAAVTAVWQVTKNREAMRSVITTFSGLEHRLELAGEVKGVRYYDDSFGTTPETAIVAVQAFTEPKVLILGGSEKNSDYSLLVEAMLDSNIRQVITIGDTGPKIADMLAKVDPNIAVTPLFARGDHALSMKEIVAAAAQRAQPGDVVLLSTGSASFGLFTDYKDRGNQFKQEVQALASAAQ